MDAKSRTKRKYESVMPTIDESWWESVLAEERQHGALHPTSGVGLVPVEPAASDGQPDWDTVRSLYADDCIITMKVSGRNRGGLLVENDRFSGFVPCSHLIELEDGQTEPDRDARLAAYIGRQLNVKIIEFVPEEQRVVFSERAALSEPGRRTQLFEKLQRGSRSAGVVTNITDFGVFVDLGGVEGLIHLSELSWGRVSHPGQVVRIGQHLDVQVLDIAPERSRIALSLKRLTPNPWERAPSDFPVGSMQPAVITRVMSYGAFARLDAGVEGLIHASEMQLAPGQDPRDALAIGQELQVRILHLDVVHQRMGLSLLPEGVA